MPHYEMCAEGPWRWARRWWRAVVAELVGTALLVALGLAAMVPLGGPRPLTHPALAFGCVVTALASALGPVSGAHLNPAVTLAALMAPRSGVDAPRALAYVAAQLAGALLGFGALAALVPAAALAGATVPAEGVTAVQAAAAEALLTALLALAVLAAWAAHDPQRPDHTVPVKIGLTVVGLVYAGGPITCASLNPARSLAPAVWLGVWDSHWVYWVGPLGGAALAALLHRALAPPPPPSPPATPAETLPLREKRDHC